MKKWRFVNGALLFVYSTWLLVYAIYGLRFSIGSLAWIDAKTMEVWIRYAIPLNWYLFPGSWVMSGLFIASACIGLKASIRKAGGGTVTRAGILGCVGGLIPVIAYFVYDGAHYPPLRQMLFPLLILALGISFQRAKKPEWDYEPFLRLCAEALKQGRLKQVIRKVIEVIRENKI